MKTVTELKLDDLSKFKLHQAFNNMSGTLDEIKRLKLEGKAFQDMRTLENAVQALECFLLGK